MDNISVHGETAIGQANGGRPSKDATVRFGVFLWLVLAFASAGFALNGTASLGLLFWLLQFASAGIAITVSVLWSKNVRKRVDAQAEAERHERAMEKDKQLAEFLEKKKQ